MLSWMAYSIAGSLILVFAGMFAEPAVRRVHAPTRAVWVLVIFTSIAWSSSTFLQGRRTLDGSDGSTLLQDSRAAHVAASASGRTDIHTAKLVETRVAEARETHGDTSDRVRLDLALLTLWFLGGLACLSVVAVSAWRIARMRRTWQRDVVAGVPVLVSHDLGPAVIGLVHHGIVVPAWVTLLDSAPQHLVMRHEREHVRAGDPLLLWSATLLVAAMPWNVALWAALRRLRHAIEIDCDARVLRGGHEPQAYCRLLIDVGERTLSGVAPIAALAEPSTLLERRITAMMATKTSTWRPVMGGIVAAGLITVACRAPRPALAPADRVTEAVRGLSAALALHGGISALTDADRRRLRSSLDSIIGQQVAAERSDSAEWLDVTPQADEIIRSAYPSLVARRDTSPVIVGIVFDTAGHVLRHTMRPDDPSYRDTRSFFAATGLDTLSSRTLQLGIMARPQWHATVLLAIERAGPLGDRTNTLNIRLHIPDSAAALLPRHGTSRSDDTAGVARAIPPSEQFGARTDSIGRVRYPAAFAAHKGAYIVAAIYSPTGSLLSTAAKKVPLTSAFDVSHWNGTEQLRPRDSQMLVELATGRHLENLRMSGGQTMYTAPHTVIVYAVLNPSR
jgi:beta-lactamase regulating signal transducer with metallopeptidase domain